MSRYDFIKKYSGIKLFESVSLEKYTTIKLKVVGDIVIVKNTKSLARVIKDLNSKKIKYHMIGWGANQILHTTDDTLFIKLDLEFDRSYLGQTREFYTLPASVPLNILTKHAQKFGLVGWDVFTGIPASLGGAIFMNAGTALGEIGELVTEVKILSSEGNIRTEKIKKDSFHYRGNNFVKPGEVILEATLRNNGYDSQIPGKIKDYLHYRKNTQPLASRNCGCVFKNHDNLHKAGQFIDLVGLKGFEFKGLQVSELHANFIENHGHAQSDDFLTLVKLISDELELYTGIKFELEAKVY